MKKLLCFALLTAGLSACENKKPAGKSKASLPNPEISRYNALLDKFAPLEFDTLAVYNEKEFTKFKGTELDSADASLFPENVKNDHFARGQGIFACNRFAIDSRRTALIARTPSEYKPSSIKLFIYDRVADSITNYIELANFWGDAGDVSDKVSWLFKGGNNEIQLYMSEMESHDNSVESRNDNTVTSKSFNYLIRLSENNFDTLSRDPKLLANKFKRVAKR